MRVSLKNISKDFRTGQIVETIKFKPSTGTRGMATVQLFNAETGELEQEVHSENVINNYLSREAFRSFFQTAISTNNGGTGMAITSNISPFHALVLSNTTAAESASAQEIRGRCCGFALKETYSGSSNTRGTLNTADTWTYNMSTQGKVTYHYVFDFPTQAANGQIRTLYWCNQRFWWTGAESDTTGHGGIRKANPTFLQTGPSPGNANSGYDWSNNYYNSCSRMQETSNKLQWIDWANMLWAGIYNSSGLTFTTINLGRMNWTSADEVKLRYADGSIMTSFPTLLCSYVNFTTNELKCVFYTNTSTTFKDMPDAYTYYETTHAFSGALISMQSMSRDLLLDANNNYPGVAYGTSNFWSYNNAGNLQLCTHYPVVPATTPATYTQVMVTVSTDFTSVSTVDLLPAIVSAYNLYYNTTSYTTDDNMLKQSIVTNLGWVKPDICEINFTTGYGGLNNYIYSTSDYHAIFDSYDRSYYFYNSNTNYNTTYIKWPCGTNNIYYTLPIASVSNSSRAFCPGTITFVPSAQNLLPTTVTKTDVNTMKIQYDFILDDVVNEAFSDAAPIGGND